MSLVEPIFGDSANSSGETSSSKTFKKKGGRKNGSKTQKEKKPLTVHQQIAKKAYSIKQQNSTIESDNNVSLRSFKGFNADSKSTNTERKEKKDRSHDSRKGDKKLSTTANRAKNYSKNSKQNGKISGTDSKRSGIPNGFRNEKQASRRPDSKLKEETPKKSATRGSKGPSSYGPVQKSKSEPCNEKSKNTGGPPEKDNKKQRGPNARIPVNKRTGPKSINKKDTGERKTENDKSRKSNISGSKEYIKNERHSKLDSIPKTDVILEKVADKSPDAIEEVEEGETLTKYTKYVPKMSYPDLDCYFNEFSYALFLEEKLESDFMQNFQIVWPTSSGSNVFLVSVKSTNNLELEKLMSPELLKLGRLPFTKRQPLILASNDESNVWYSYVKEAALKKNMITILLELYPWNKNKLPTKQASDDFKILPCSAQTNRIFFAMTRVKNPKFIDLILGQKPVKQINFYNRLQLTKESFNDSQRSAIQHVLNNSVTILQGPPGTGKTSTIEEIIIQMIKNFHSFPILCVAASNIAIDNIAEKFMDNWPEIKILRIVSDGKEQQYNNEHPLGKICLHNIVNEQLSPDMKEVIVKLRSGRTRDLSKNQYNKLLTSQNDISDRHVLQAQILFTTNIAAGGRQLKALKELPVVIMDEATQSSEASTLVPLSLPGIRTFVFVGDQKQLSSFSNIPQLQMSLFERVLLNGCYTKPHMLDTQYRMHPKISEFPVMKFYNGGLKDGVTSEQKEWPGIKYPLFFHQCDRGSESKVFSSQRGTRGFTYNNINEAEQIIKILYKLILDKGVKNDQIGVITPYSAQRDLLSEIIVNDLIINPKKMAMEQEVDEADLLNGNSNRTNGAKKNTINIINGVFVSTIDSFQGHEKSFIIFSCVRNNKENKIGFVSDRRRMNVALTRAKNGLILVGNKNVLADGDPLWGEYIQYLQSRDCIFDSLDVY